MISAMFKGLGRLALGLATMAFLATVGLFVLGSFLTTWPILRLSPKEQRLKATIDLASAGMAALQVFAAKKASTSDEVERVN